MYVCLVLIKTYYVSFRNGTPLVVSHTTKLAIDEFVISFIRIDKFNTKNNGNERNGTYSRNAGFIHH